MGVWIETIATARLGSIGLSHPAWVCGLKHRNRRLVQQWIVTPCVGVWIETHTSGQQQLVS